MTVVSPMLLRLAAERATGALLRDHGTLYLLDGRVVHAESPVAPGVDVLLTAGGRLPRRSWEEAVARAGARHEVGRFLVDSGRLGDGELEICHLGALFDAAFFALTPGSGPARFRYGVGHWFGTVRPVSVAEVERETLRRRELLDGVWPYPAVDTAPVVPRPGAPGQPVTARQRELLGYADGTRTPSDLARVLGRPAFHTLLDVRRLAAAGLVATPLDTPAADAPAGEPPAPGHEDPGAPHPGATDLDPMGGLDSTGPGSTGSDPTDPGSTDLDPTGPGPTGPIPTGLGGRVPRPRMPDQWNPDPWSPDPWAPGAQPGASGAPVPHPLPPLPGGPAGAGGPPPVLPVRRPGRIPYAAQVPTAPSAPPVTPVPSWVADIAPDPDIALLRRLRDALEAQL